MRKPAERWKEARSRGGRTEARGEVIEGDAAHREAGAVEKLAAGKLIEVGVGGIH
jgi:hypothetical protein